MTELPIRRVQPDEAEAFIRSVRVPFLDPATGRPEDDAWMERAVRHTETERAWVAEDRGRFVANCIVHTMDVTVPSAPGRDCPVIPMGGVSAVGVHPTHRRRGLLRRMMAEMLEDCRQRDEPVAGLLASESVIYGRFGFGLATDAATVEIDTREAAVTTSVPELELQLLERDEWSKVLPDLFDRQRRVRAGEPGRTNGKWEEYLADEPRRRHGGNPAFVAAGEDGYVVYRAFADSSYWQRERVVVEELRGVTPDAEAGLWKFVCGLDLIDRVTAMRRPLDDPFRWRLADPRQLRTVQIEDRLHVRILDVPAAFRARGYAEEGRLVLDVVAPPVEGGPSDAVPGRWVLDAGPDGAVCRPAARGEDPDVRLDVTALGALYMGGYTASLLAAAGRVEELKPGGLRAADRLLSTWPAPLTGTGF